MARTARPEATGVRSAWREVVLLLARLSAFPDEETVPDEEQ